MEYDALVPIKQRLKEYRPEFDTKWVSRQILRRLVKAKFRVSENESDSAPFSIAKFPQKSEMHFCKGQSRYLSKYLSKY